MKLLNVDVRFITTSSINSREKSIRTFILPTPILFGISANLLLSAVDINMFQIKMLLLVAVCVSFALGSQVVDSSSQDPAPPSEVGKGDIHIRNVRHINPAYENSGSDKQNFVPDDDYLGNVPRLG